MTLTQVFLLVITLCVVTLTIGVMMLILRLLPLVRGLGSLTEEGRALGRRLHDVTGELETMVRDVRRVEERAAGVVRGVIDRVEPPLQQLTAVLAGVASAISAISRLLPGTGRSEIARPVEPHE
jgi:hypothetical protein